MLTPPRHPAGMNDQAGRLRTASAEAGKFGLVHVGGRNSIRPQGTRKREATGGRPTAGLPSRRLSWSYTDLCIGVQRLALDFVYRLSAADLICRIPNQPTIHPNLPLYDGVIAMVYFSFEYVSMPVFPL